MFRYRIASVCSFEPALTFERVYPDNYIIMHRSRQKVEDIEQENLDLNRPKLCPLYKETKIEGGDTNEKNGRGVEWSIHSVILRHSITQVVGLQKLR